MSRILLSLALAFSLGIGGIALAQATTAPDNSATSATNPHNMPGMAATSSDSGQMSTGASSQGIGTSHANARGVMSPKAPAATGEGATGANPHNPGGLPNNQ